MKIVNEIRSQPLNFRLFKTLWKYGFAAWTSSPYRRKMVVKKASSFTSCRAQGRNLTVLRERNSSLAGFLLDEQVCIFFRYILPFSFEQTSYISAGVLHQSAGVKRLKTTALKLFSASQVALSGNAKYCLWSGTVYIIACQKLLDFAVWLSFIYITFCRSHI